METKQATHTPGKWCIPDPHTREDEPIGICADDRDGADTLPLICEVNTSCVSAEQALSDARLIAAAPELLAELTAAPDLPDDWDGPDAVEAFTDAYRRWLHRRDAAIRNARGE